MTEPNKDNFDPGGYEVPPELWEMIKSTKPIVGIYKIHLDQPVDEIINVDKDYWWLDEPPPEQIPVDAFDNLHQKLKALFELICNQLRIPALLDGLERLLKQFERGNK